MGGKKETPLGTYYVPTLQMQALSKRHMVWEVRGQWGGAMNPAFYGLGGVNNPRLVDKLLVDF